MQQHAAAWRGSAVAVAVAVAAAATTANWQTGLQLLVGLAALSGLCLICTN